MSSPLHVLILEDRSSDADLMIVELRHSGLDLCWRRVATEAEYLAGLESAPDIILADFHLPQFDALEALQLLQQRGLDIPFIIVSGDIGEDQAVEAMKQGAADYLLKDRLARLGQSVIHALQQQQLKIEKKQAEIEIIATHAETLRARDELQHANEQLLLAVKQANALKDSIERESQTKSVLLAAISSILIGVDENDCVTLWNTAAENAFGLPSASILGKPFVECAIPWDWSYIREHTRICRQTGSSARLAALRYTRPGGREGILGITLTPIFADTNKQPGVLLLGADITDRKLLEGQLAHAQKMESIGQLAAGIAHEINTPTQYIGDNTRFLQEAFADLCSLFSGYVQLLHACKSGVVDRSLVTELETALEKADVEYLFEEVPKAIQQSLDGIARVSKIVQAMKEFSHPGTEEKVAIDINRAIESTLTVAHNEWKYVAEVTTDFDPVLPMVPCLPGDFNQVILNIVINAAHAIAAVVGDGSQQKGQIKVSTRLAEDWAEIRISDTGTGIPEAIRSRVFDPFFTTKEVGKGTGQGLALAHSAIVDKHGGNIHFESETGKGTTFVIRLPLAEMQSKKAQAA